MSKSVEAHYKGQIVSTRDLPTGYQQECSLVVPTVRAPRCLTEPSTKSHQKQPTKRPEREPSVAHPHKGRQCVLAAQIRAEQGLDTGHALAQDLPRQVFYRL
jgi:hypothetical protein